MLRMRKRYAILVSLIGSGFLLVVGLLWGGIIRFSSSAPQTSQTSQTEAYRRGMVAYLRNDYATAQREWQPLAQQGYPPAQTGLGLTSMRVIDGVANGTEAVQWFQKAAAQGDAVAQLSLGSMYRTGLWVTRDRVEAMQWFEKAAAQGNATAQASLKCMQKEVLNKAKSENERRSTEDECVRLAFLDPPATEPTPPPVTPPPAAPPRRALVIGNAAYSDSPLTNPVNDATDVTALLRRLGFEVALHKNADKPTMEKAVDVFTRDVPKGSAGLFFYAGHGVQIDGVNYLVPIGARFSVASDVKYHAVAADWVLDRMHKSGMDVKLLLLDACRDNPLGRSGTRTLTRGLAVMQSPKGALIAYATSPGETALDGQGRNSPFTVQLLRELGSPGRDIEGTLKEVRVGVHTITQGQQIPWVASSIIGNFYLAQ